MYYQYIDIWYSLAKPRSKCSIIHLKLTTHQYIGYEKARTFDKQRMASSLHIHSTIHFRFGRQNSTSKFVENKVANKTVGQSKSHDRFSIDAERTFKTNVK